MEPVQALTRKEDFLLQFGILFLLALGLAMDAAAVSVVNGIVHTRRPIRLGLACGLSFGLFQALMLLTGAFSGAPLAHLIGGCDHWIALILLGVIGGRMIADALKERSNPQPAPPVRLTLRTLLLQAFATSIDALATGVGLGVLGADMAHAALMTGAVTFVCCFLGVQAGRLAGKRFSDKAQLLGGVVLVLLGIHIFMEHVGGR